MIVHPRYLNTSLNTIGFLLIWAIKQVMYNKTRPLGATCGCYYPMYLQIKHCHQLGNPLLGNILAASPHFRTTPLRKSWRIPLSYKTQKITVDIPSAWICSPGLALSVLGSCLCLSAPAAPAPAEGISPDNACSILKYKFPKKPHERGNKSRHQFVRSLLYTPVHWVDYF